MVLSCARIDRVHSKGFPNSYVVLLNSQPGELSRKLLQAICR